MTALAASLVILFSWLGVVVTLLTLPGTWVAVLAALLVKWWQPELLGWWAIGICAGLAVVGEIIEFGAGSVGAKKAGGSKHGAWGALIGGLVGSVLGTVLIPIPLLGTIIGAVVGAGVGAMIAERGVAQRPWKESMKSGSGAAIGRAVSVVAKGAVAAVIAVILTLAVLIPGF